jgi:hypothetical protein
MGIDENDNEVHSVQPASAVLQTELGTSGLNYAEIKFKQTILPLYDFGINVCLTELSNVAV